MEELWRPVKDWEGKYEVSNLGRVRNAKTLRVRKLREHKEGYLTIGFTTYENGKRNCKFYLVHRLVALAFIPNPTGLPVVDHIDKNKHNNCVENLRWVTAQENSRNYDYSV